MTAFSTATPERQGQILAALAAVNLAGWLVGVGPEGASALGRES